MFDSVLPIVDLLSKLESVLSNPAASRFHQGGGWLTSLAWRVSALSWWPGLQSWEGRTDSTTSAPVAAEQARRDGGGFPLSFCSSPHFPAPAPAPAPAPSNLRCTLHNALPQIFPTTLAIRWASLVAQRLKHLPTTQETWVRSLGWEDPLEKEMATHSSSLAWRIPWTEEPGGLWSTGSRTVGHDWATSLSLSLSKCTSWVATLPFIYQLKPWCQLLRKC